MIFLPYAEWHRNNSTCLQWSCVPLVFGWVCSALFMQILHVLISWIRMLGAFSSLCLNRHLVAHFLWRVLWDNATVFLESLFVTLPCPWRGVSLQAASLVLWLLQLTCRAEAAAFKKQTSKTLALISHFSSQEENQQLQHSAGFNNHLCVVQAQLNFTVFWECWKQNPSLMDFLGLPSYTCMAAL